MKIFLFELKKLWRQKKFLWVSIICLLCTVAIFQSNANEQEGMMERAQEELILHQEIVNGVQRDLSELDRQQELPEIQQNQLNLTKEMNLILMQLNRVMEREDWEDVYPLKLSFLELVEQYEAYGEPFPILTGQELIMEKALAEWFISYNLSYEDEEYPVSPHLIVKELSEWAFSLAGLFVMLLLFGNIFTSEREQRTWLTLHTQPIRKWELLVSKYISLLAATLIFMALFIVVGLAIPSVFSEYSFSGQYPILIQDTQTFYILPIMTYIIRTAIFFVSAAIFLFSLVTFLSSLLKNTFITIMLSSFIIMVGYSLTELNDSLQMAGNPFQLFRISALSATIPTGDDWIYPCLSIMWAFILILFAYFIPEIRSMPFSQESSHIHPFKSKNGSLLNRLMFFEWRKVIRKKLFVQINILLLLFVTVSYFILFQQSSAQETQYLEDLSKMEETETWIALSEEAIDRYEEVKEQSGENIYDDIIADVEKSINFFKERREKGIEAAKEYERKNWTAFFEYQLFDIHTAAGEIDTGGFYLDNRMDNLGKFTVEASIAEKEWLIKNKIQPIFTGTFIPTIYHQFPDEELYQTFKEENRKLDSSGLFSIYLFNKYYLYFIPILLCFFLFGGGLASERGKKQTLHLLQTQPLALSNLFLGKIMTSSILSIASGVGLFLIIVLIGSLFNRFGDWLYPILYYNHEDIVNSSDYSGLVSSGYGYHFIPLGEYLLSSVIFFVLCLLFVLALTMVLSTFMKNALTVFSASILLNISGYYATTKLGMDIAHLLPFTYFDFPKVINGELSIVMDNAKINVLYGCLVLSGLSIFLILIGYWVLSIKKIRK
ncbi:ABC transporter permease subunit [Sutcliffiella horikoshii]|uniref:ABC transporter permease subunit n=1 Tax=Sutcliffiella horikoshii TaxID=79883 RepID=UPI0038512866